MAIRIFEEIAESTYVHNAVSRILIDPTFRTLIIGMYVQKDNGSIYCRNLSDIPQV